jgi:hypothetical protein
MTLGEENDTYLLHVEIHHRPLSHTQRVLTEMTTTSTSVHPFVRALVVGACDSQGFDLDIHSTRNVESLNNHAASIDAHCMFDCKLYDAASERAVLTVAKTRA